MNYKEAGLRESEYLSLKKTLGREPNELELRIMGVMWSEHCSYKSTRPLLKKLPKEGRFVVLGPGENAGVIDGGAGIGIAFKVESHNHPSAVAPYQGASSATSSLWALGRSPRLTGCSSAPSSRRSTTASSRASAATATASACPPSAARPVTIPPTRAIRSSTP